MKAKITFFYLVVFFVFLACKQEQKTNNKIQIEKNNSSTLEIMITECWNNKNMEKLREIASDDFVRNVNDITVAKSRNEMEAAMNLFFTGFPDLNVTLSNTVVQGNRIFTNWTATGTNTGVYGEVQATGKKVKFSGYAIDYYDESGKFIREDIYYNELMLLQQLGYGLSPPIME
ncbi:MAG: ester cyclase [Bacteroidia bacterium]|nr:ester cyclase [Bacteroidia bacterium]